MRERRSHPPALLQASPSPATKPWCVHGVCAGKVSLYAIAALFLIFLEVNLYRIPDSLLLAPRDMLIWGLNCLVCWKAFGTKLAISQYGWGRKVLHVGDEAVSPVPLSESVSMFLWWLSLFTVTLTSKEMDETVAIALSTRDEQTSPHAEIQVMEETPKRAFLIAFLLLSWFAVLWTLSRFVASAVPSTYEEAQDQALLIESLMFSFFDTCQLYFKGARNTSVEVGQYLYDRYLALLAYICFNGNDKGVDRITICRQALYEGAENKDNAFDQDRGRLFDDLNELAQKLGFLPIPVDKLFDKLGQGRWRACALVTYDQWLINLLQLWKRHVLEAHVLGMLVDRMRLREMCIRVIQTYGDGFLAVYQMRDKALWGWARKPYLEYRACYLMLLKYAADQEIDACRKPGENREECLRYAALYLECAMLAVLKVQPDRKRGEEFKGQCLKLYRLLEDECSIERVNVMFETLTKQK